MHSNSHVCVVALQASGQVRRGMQVSSATPSLRGREVVTGSRTFKTNQGRLLVVSKVYIFISHNNFAMCVEVLQYHWLVSCLMSVTLVKASFYYSKRTASKYWHWPWSWRRLWVQHNWLSGSCVSRIVHTSSETGPRSCWYFERNSCWSWTTKQNGAWLAECDGWCCGKSKRE